MIDKGLVTFIKKKLELGVPLDQIHASLVSAGFTLLQIKEGFAALGKVYNDTHQDIVAANDFLPPLKKTQLLEKPTRLEEVEAHLFAGRLRRRDFILGFLFFFGLGTVVSAVASVLVKMFAPHIHEGIIAIVQNPADTSWLIFIPLLLAPITFFILSLAARRLHDMDLPGRLSLALLGYFVPSSSLIHPISIVGLQIVATVLFIMMITKQGTKATNRYGEELTHEGSIFARIFNFG